MFDELSNVTSIAGLKVEGQKVPTGLRRKVINEERRQKESTKAYFSISSDGTVV